MGKLETVEWEIARMKHKQENRDGILVLKNSLRNTWDTIRPKSQRKKKRNQKEKIWRTC